MASNYPGSLDSFDTIASDKKTSDVVGGRTHRDMHNDLGDAIEAVQAELGTDPAGAYATVKARFEAIEGSTLPQIDAKGDLIVGTADNTYDNLGVGTNDTVLVADSGQAKGVKWGTTVGVWTVAGLHVGYTAKTGAYTATVSDDVINVTSGTFTLNLPAANTCAGKTLRIKNSGTGVVTVDGNSAETVEGVATFPLGAGSYVEFTCTGSAWILTGGTPDSGLRDISSLLINSWSTPSAVYIRRRGRVVTFYGAIRSVSGAASSNDFMAELATEWKPPSNAIAGHIFNSTDGNASLVVKGGAGAWTIIGTRAADKSYNFTLTWLSGQSWPATLPGTAA